MKKSTSFTQPYWMGIDWGTKHHAVSIVDNQRQVIAKFTSPATLKGMEALGTTLAELGHVAGVAIETTHAPIFYYLSNNGYPVYPVNPKLSKQWREGTSVAGNKSDARDGRVLAMELSRRHDELRVFQPKTPATGELLALCAKQRALIDQRTALLQQLRASLSIYYPAALAFFSDLSSPTAWAFVKRFPTPSSLVQARKDTLIRFLRAHRIGLKPVWLERIEARKEALSWPAVPCALAEEVVSLACVAQLQALQTQLDRLEKLIEERAKELPETQLLQTLPGVGVHLGPALAAMIRAVQEEAGGLQALRCLSGVAPVEDSSGKRCQNKIRRRCNKQWRTTMHLFAACSIAHCAWAEAFYDLCKQRGDGHATALRKLADKWLRIIFRMLQNAEPYDEKKYLDSLAQKHSPVFARIGAKTCG